MKNLKILFLAAILFFTASCDDSCLELLGVIIKDDTLSIGDELELDISATDCDGIDSISIKIPSLSIEMVREQFPTPTKMDFEEKIPINETIIPGNYEVKVTLVDGLGNEKIDISDFTIN